MKRTLLFNSEELTIWEETMSEEVTVTPEDSSDEVDTLSDVEATENVEESAVEGETEEEAE